MIFDLLFLGSALIKEKLSISSAQAMVEQKNRELVSMPVWDGAERQIMEYQQFHHKPWDWYKCDVKFGGDPTKWCKMSLQDVQRNRQFWGSGLSVADFAKEYYLQKYRENPDWLKQYQEDVFRCLYLWDKDGNEIRIDIWENLDQTFTLYIHSWPDDSYDKRIEVSMSEFK